MDVTEAIRQRKSIRAFKPDPVPKDILKKLIEQALRAPSWANTQPWEFAIVSSKQLREIQKGFVERGEQTYCPDVARPYEFPEPYISRIRALGPRNRTLTREEIEARLVRNFVNYDAPAVIDHFLKCYTFSNCFMCPLLYAVNAENYCLDTCLKQSVLLGVIKQVCICGNGNIPESFFPYVRNPVKQVRIQ